MGAAMPNPSSRGRPQAGFAHLRPPLMSNVRPRTNHTNHTEDHLSQTNPYSPPAAPVGDVHVASEPAKRRVPRTFLVLLAIYFLLEVLGAVVTGQFIWLARTAI